MSLKPELLTVPGALLLGVEMATFQIQAVDTTQGEPALVFVRLGISFRTITRSCQATPSRSERPCGQA